MSLEPKILSKFFVSLYYAIRNHICYCPTELILRDVSLQFYIRLTLTCVEEHVKKLQNGLTLRLRYVLILCKSKLSVL